MKDKHAIIILLLIIAALCFSLWATCRREPQTDSHRDHADVIAANDTLKAHDSVYARVIDSLKKDNHKLDSANKKLVVGQAQTERKLNAKVNEVQTLVEQIREINQDTGYFGHLLDSLQQQVASLTFLIVQYEQYADSINNVNAAQKGNYEAMIQEKDKRYAELKATYDKLLKAYQELFADNVKAQKTVKRERLKTKVAALLALVAGGAAVIK